ILFLKSSHILVSGARLPSGGCRHAWFPPPVRLEPDRSAGGPRASSRAPRPAVAGGAEGARSRSPPALPEPSQTPGPCRRSFSRYVWLPPPGPAGGRMGDLGRAPSAAAGTGVNLPTVGLPAAVPRAAEPATVAERPLRPQSPDLFLSVAPRRA